MPTCKQGVEYPGPAPTRLMPRRTQVGVPALGSVQPVQLALGTGRQQVQDGGACAAAPLHRPLIPECFSIEPALWVRLQLQLLHQLLHLHLGRGSREGMREARDIGGEVAAAAAPASSLQGWSIGGMCFRHATSFQESSLVGCARSCAAGLVEQLGFGGACKRTRCYPNEISAKKLRSSTCGSALVLCEGLHSRFCQAVSPGHSGRLGPHFDGLVGIFAVSLYFTCASARW